MIGFAGMICKIVFIIIIIFDPAYLAALGDLAYPVRYF